MIITLHLDQKLLTECMAIAQKLNITFNELVVMALKEYIDKVKQNE